METISLPSTYWLNCQSPTSIRIWNHFSGLPSQTKRNFTRNTGKTPCLLSETPPSNLLTWPKAEFPQDELLSLYKQSWVQMQSQTELSSSRSLKMIGERKQEMCHSSWKFLRITRTIQCGKGRLITRGLRIGGGAGQSPVLTWQYYLSPTISNCKILVLSASTAGNGLLQREKIVKRGHTAKT